jgi:hypothetical protein
MSFQEQCVKLRKGKQACGGRKMLDLNRTPEVASLLLTKKVYNNERGELNTETVYHRLLFNNFPSTVIFMDVLVTWIGVEKTFVQKVQLIDPDNNVLFQSSDEVYVENDNHTWGYSVALSSVFFWVYRSGIHTLQVIVDNKLIKERHLEIRAVKEKSTFEFQAKNSLLGGLTISRDANFNEGAAQLVGVLTPSGLYKLSKITLFFVWDYIHKNTKLKITFCDPAKQPVRNSVSQLERTRGLYSIAHIELIHYYPLPPWHVGVNWILLEWEDGEMYHPFLIWE